MKLFFAPFLFFLLLLAFPVVTNAQVLINEFSSWDTSGDWVEIYNIGKTNVDLSGYIIRDSTTTNKVVLSGQIESFGFATFDFMNRLNKKNDTVRLLKVTETGETLIDSIPYGLSGQVCAPGSGETVGRVTDGINTIDRFLAGTKNSTNNGSELDPCPSPTEFKTPTPHVTPTHELVSTATLTPKSVTTTPFPLDYGSGQKEKLPASGGSVLSEKTDILAGDAKESLEKKSIVATQSGNSSFRKGLKSILAPGLFVVGGFLFLIAALFPILKKNKKRYTFKDEKNAN